MMIFQLYFCLNFPYRSSLLRQRAFYSHSILASGQGIVKLCLKVNYCPAELSHNYSQNLRNPRLPFSLAEKGVPKLNEKVDGEKIPTTNNPKLLGLILDSLHFFTYQVTAVGAKLQRRNIILKALTHTKLEKDKET